MKKAWICIVVLALMFVVYKGLMLSIYRIEPIKFDKTVIFTDVIEVDKTKEVKHSDLLEVDELTVKNFFKDYEKAPGDSVFKVLKDEEGNIISFYYMVSMKEYKDTISFESLGLYTEANVDIINKSEVEPKLKDYFDKNNIHNDIDLFNYIKENYYFKSNLFTSTRKIIINYLLNTFVSVTIPDFNSISLIQGNLNGYIINNDRVREIHLLNNDKQYVIILGGEITTDEFIDNLLETVKFK